MIYLDSSSSLKLLWNELKSSAVIGAIAAEETCGQLFSPRYYWKDA
jgi:hypothetical protein